MDWTSLLPNAIGTLIGALGAYVGMRVDLALLSARMAADREHYLTRFATLESTARSAHDRIDRIVSQSRTS